MIFRLLFPKKRIPWQNRNGVCTDCAWTGSYKDTKHRSTNQLQAKGVINDKGKIIDPHILAIKRKNGGWVDLAWCPKCDSFIETYYDTETE
jgi:hypothetical protein